MSPMNDNRQQLNWLYYQ